MSKLLNCKLISDFTINPVETYIKQEFSSCTVNCDIAPIDQVRQYIDSIHQEASDQRTDIILIWTRPERQIHHFFKLCYNNSLHIDLLLSEVTEYSNYIKKAAQMANIVIVPSWTLQSYFRGSGILDLKNSAGIGNVLMRMNLKLSEELEHTSNVYLLNSDYWIKACKKSYDEKMWYLGKIPYTREVFMNAAKDIKNVHSAVMGNARKLIVVDLDNTLWGGVIGDDGIEGIKLGGIDSIGEAFVDFQKELKALKNRGILLAICSKNEEAVALNAIDNHPEMVLKRSDFAAYQINWNDKAENIEKIAHDLNLGLHSVVFIDDSKYERERVAEALTEVFVPDWPVEPIYYRSYLNQLGCFDVASYSREDSQRAKYYHDEQNRRAILKNTISAEKWLEQLGLKVYYEKISTKNIQRAAQLLNKTNQFNLITRRLEQAEFANYCTKKNIVGYVFRAEDKFGDYGIIGLCTFRVNVHFVEIIDFVLSCRAMGREIEKAMLYAVKKYAADSGKNCINASFIPTLKNKPCEKFLEDNGFLQKEDHYSNHQMLMIKKPKHIWMNDYSDNLINSAG